MESLQFEDHGSESPDERPPRPTSSEALLFPTNISVSPNPTSPNEPLLRRKPVIPRRSSRQSLEARSYEPIQMKQMDTSQLTFDHNADEDLTTTPVPPKAFRKTHLFLGYNFGYWRMPVRHMSIFSILFLVTFLPVWFASKGFSSIQSVNGPFSFDCTGSENGWSFAGINIRYGRFQYGAAKTIDLAWNWIVGRGLQGVLAFVAYRVFQDALLRAAELTPLSYEVYAALALYSTKLDILWQLSKGLFRFGNWRTKAIFIWLIISTIYLAVFPSLMDVCSGYDSAYIADFQWPNGTFTSTDDLSDWQDNTSIVVDTAIECCAWNISETTNEQYDTTCYIERPVYLLGECREVWSMQELNVTTLYYWQDSDLNTSYWNEYEKNIGEVDETEWSDWGFAPVNPDNFKCIAQNNLYQYGFSFEWLFVAAIVNSVWLYGLWIVWLDCDTNSEPCKKGRRLGLWRAIADISEAMRDELGPNICAYAEQELADALRNRPPIKYYAKKGTDGEPGHIGLSSRHSERLRLQWNHDYGTKRQNN